MRKDSLRGDYEVLRELENDVPDILQFTNSFLPENAVGFQYLVNLQRGINDDPFQPNELSNFIAGDIVVFYSRTSLRHGANANGGIISHVMIALGENLLIGTNNASTFEGGTVLLQQFNTQVSRLSNEVLIIRSLTAQHLVDDHNGA